MKRIGLCVCYDTKNFGSQLQVLATDRKIQEFGYETEMIRYQKRISLSFAAQTLPRLFNPYFVRGKIAARGKRQKIARRPQAAKNVAERNARFTRFAAEYFPNLSVPYQGWEQLKRESAKRYDAFVCGSDQLWLPGNLGSHFYTLEFAPDDKPKIAYATSFGVSQIPMFQRQRTRRYLNRFQSLSTRELRGAQIIEELTGRTAQVVCDPTLLFPAADWDRMIPEKREIQGSYIFCYFLGTNPEHRKAARELQEETGLRIVTCPFLDHYVPCDERFGDLQLFDLDAADFVNLIRHAEYVLTDSFHGSVFSILYHKRFVTFNRFGEERNSRNSRIDSLCSLLGVEGRRARGDIREQMDTDIDYHPVDEKLRKLRRDSLAYLETALSEV